MNENGLNYIDLFAGAGGLSEGFIQSGYRPVAHVEMNEHAAKTIETRIAYYYLKDKGNTLTVVEAIAGKESKVTDLARGTSIYSSKSGSKNLVHYGSKGGKKYVLLRYNGIAN